MYLNNIGRPAHESDAANVRYLLDMLNTFDEKVTEMVYKTYTDLNKDNPIKNIDEFKTKYKQ